jgi:hypothetical protein
LFIIYIKQRARKEKNEGRIEGVGKKFELARALDEQISDFSKAGRREKSKKRKGERREREKPRVQ